MNPTPEINEEVKRFLKKHNTAVVATVWEGEPYASTVHYVSDDDLSIYFLAHRNTNKYLNVSSHQKASVVIGTGPKHISIQARGNLDLSVEKEAEMIIQKFKWLKGSQLIQHWPIEEMAKFEDKEPVAFKFEPLEMTFMNLDDEEYPESKGKEYYQII
jgi:uncharacterized protein YhbP (UPF0306 family)